MIDTPASFDASWPAKPAECLNGCPDSQVCDHCQCPVGQSDSDFAFHETADAGGRVASTAWIKTVDAKPVHELQDKLDALEAGVSAAPGEAGESDAAKRLYEHVGKMGFHGPNPRPWSERSDEHKQQWVDAVRATQASPQPPQCADARVAELEAVLDAMVEEQSGYMRINNLGDPEKQHNIKRARAALAKEPRS